MANVGKKSARRHRRPNGTAWHRKWDDGWYFTPPGKRPVPLRHATGEPVKGLDAEVAAKAALARITLNVQPVDFTGWNVTQACTAYVAFAKGEAYANVDQSEKLLRDFCTECGGLSVAQLTKNHLRKWINSHAGWKSAQTKRNAATVVISALSYAVKECGLPGNPLEGYDKEKEVTRVALAFTAEQERAIIANASAAFGAFFRMLILIGCRPSELASITRERVQYEARGRMLFRIPVKDGNGKYAHKTARKTQKDRLILVGAEAEAIVRNAMKTAPEGKAIFRTPRGHAWTKKHWTQAFWAVAEKIGLPAELCLYVCRHTFAKRLLTGETTGHPVALGVVAALMGNSEKVCRKHYAQWLGTEEPLWAAVGAKKVEAEAELAGAA